MMRIKISNIIIELPEELVAQIPYFKALSNEFYQNNKEYVDINEPAISLNALTRIIDLFQGNKMPMLEEYIPTFEFLGIDYYKDKIEDESESSSLQEYIDNDNELHKFNLEINYTKPLIEEKDQNSKYIYDLMKYDNIDIHYYTISHDCDILEKIYIKIELPVLKYGTYWKNKVGLILIDKINFAIGKEKNVIIFNKEFFNLEYNINNNDYWQIFDYSEKDRKIKSCCKHNIIIPLRLSESMKYGFNLASCVFYSMRLNIILNKNINQLIEGEINDNIEINNVSLYNKGIFGDRNIRFKLASYNLHQQVKISQYTNYKFIEYDICDTDHFTLTNLYDNQIKMDYIVFIRLNGIIISNNFKKFGDYYYIKTDKVINEIVQFKEKRDYNIKIIVKYTNLILYSAFSVKIGSNLNEPSV